MSKGGWEYSRVRSTKTLGRGGCEWNQLLLVNLSKLKSKARIGGFECLDKGTLIRNDMRQGIAIERHLRMRIEEFKRYFANHDFFVLQLRSSKKQYSTLW